MNKARKLRRQLYRVQDGRCYLCGQWMKPPWLALPNERGGASLDHIDPSRKYNRFGREQNHRGHVAMAHRECNSAKGGREPTACERLFGQIIAEVMAEWPPPYRRRRKVIRPKD